MMPSMIHDAGAVYLPLIKQVDALSQRDRHFLMRHVVARTAAAGLTVAFAVDAARHLIAGVSRIPVALVLLVWDRTRFRDTLPVITRNLMLTIRYIALLIFGAAPAVILPWKATAVAEWVGRLTIAPQKKSFAVRAAVACAWKSPYLRAVAGLAAAAAFTAAAWHFVPAATMQKERTLVLETPTLPLSPPLPPSVDPESPPLPTVDFPMPSYQVIGDILSSVDPESPPLPTVDSPMPSYQVMGDILSSVDPGSPPLPAVDFPMPSYQVMGGILLAALSLGGVYYARPKGVALAARVKQLVQSVTINKLKELATRQMIFGFPPELLASLVVSLPVVLLTNSFILGIAVATGSGIFAEKKIQQWRKSGVNPPIVA